jgi:2-oxoglutarate ferredoxin oxidoreductase subunit alpha
MDKRKAMKGNHAMGEAAIRAGVEFFAGYPITPQTEMMEYLSRRLPEEGRVFFQAESEIGSSNMVLGAAVGGARAMTATSGPGLALMAEVLSKAAVGRMPMVLVDISRYFDGIAPSQGDYNFLVKGLGHGGLRPFVVSPMTVQEAIELLLLCFEKSWEYCIPAVLLTDGMLGQTTEGVVLPKAVTQLPPPKYRVPNGKKGREKYFQTYNGNYKELGYDDAYEACVNDTVEMYRSWVENEVRFEEYLMEDAEYVVFSYGSAARICIDTVNQLRGEGIKAGMFRPITLFPFPEKQIAALRGLKGALSVEMANPEQFLEDVKLHLDKSIPLASYTRCGGNVIVSEEAADALKAMMA